MTLVRHHLMSQSVLDKVDANLDLRDQVGSE